MGRDTVYVGTDRGSNVETGSTAPTLYSELASLWNYTLGNIVEYDIAGNQFPAGWGLTNVGDLEDLQIIGRYSFGVEYEPNSEFCAWSFNGSNGHQVWNVKTANCYLWPVHSGCAGASVAQPVPLSGWVGVVAGCLILGIQGRQSRAAACALA